MSDEARLHAGGTVQWDASDALLNWLRANLKPGMRTLETGAGKSTLAFAAAGCEHQTVTPASAEIANIRAEAVRRGTSMEQVTFHEGYSQYVLPHLEGSEDLDVVFIDGGHGFPIPGVDWLYLAPRLKIGGTLLIDDVDLWTGSMLVDVLRKEPGWQVVEVLRGRTAVVRKTAPFVAREWCHQPAVVAKSFLPQLWRKFSNGVGLLLRFDFKALSRKIKVERDLARAARAGF